MDVREKERVTGEVALGCECFSRAEGVDTNSLGAIFIFAVERREKRGGASAIAAWHRRAAVQIRVQGGCRQW